MSKAGRELLATLSDAGLLGYGAVVPRSVVHDTLGIRVPETAPKRVYDALAVREVSAVDYVRAQLLNAGKFFAETPDGYRVLLPSENVGQIERYIEHADRKLARALKLSRMSPVNAQNAADQTEARILFKRDGARRRLLK